MRRSSTVTEYLNAVDNNQLTPLDAATQNGSHQHIQALKFFLMFIVCIGHIDVALWLLNRGATTPADRIAARHKSSQA